MGKSITYSLKNKFNSYFNMGYLSDDEYYGYHTDKNYGLGLQSLLNLDRYNRLYNGTTIQKHNRDLYKLEYPKFVTDPPSSNRVKLNKVGEAYCTEVVNSTSLTHDSAIWSYFGPVNGTLAYLTLKETIGCSRGDLDNLTILGDLRRYFYLGDRTWTLSRISAGKSFGKRPTEFVLERGYPEFNEEKMGTNYALLSNEIRFPLVDAIFFPYIGTFGGLFSNFRGSLFFDVGDAWSNNEKPNWKGNLGFGIQINAGLLIKADVSRETDFRHTWKDLNNNPAKWNVYATYAF